MTPNAMNELVRQIRYEADISARTGQLDRLHAIADKLESHATALADMAKRMEAAERDAGWVSVKDRLPPENGSYLIAYKWPGHGNIVYKKVTQFLHTAYDTKYMAWNESSEVSKHITHWRPLPADPDYAATQEGEG